MLKISIPVCCSVVSDIFCGASCQFTPACMAIVFSPEKSKPYAADNDEELDSDEAYDAETDVDDVDENNDGFPPLPDFFAGRVFVLFVPDGQLRKVISDQWLWIYSTQKPIPIRAPRLDLE